MPKSNLASLLYRRWAAGAFCLIRGAGAGSPGDAMWADTTIAGLEVSRGISHWNAPRAALRSLSWGAGALMDGACADLSQEREGWRAGGRVILGAVAWLGF